MVYREEKVVGGSSETAETHQGEEDGMAEPEGPFFQAGADGVLLSDYRAIADSGRYPVLPVMAWLARFIVGQGGGPNKDSPLFELCHLIRGVDALGGGNEARWLFFLGSERVLPRTVKANVERDLAAGAPDWITVLPEGITLHLPDGDRGIRYGRMPFLIALYEFLIGMDGFAFADELATIFDEMSAADPSVGNVRKATNAAAAILRRYRRDHMTWARNDEKFDPVHRFLTERATGREIIVDDQAILDFWLLHSDSGDFRGYKTVFDTFIRYMRALSRTGYTRTAEDTATIGTDFEAGEIDPEDTAYDLTGFGEWCSPFDVFDRPEMEGLNFFKGSSERSPIESLMHYGPDAIRLSRAFLRLESFGPVQSGITTDLQVRRGRESVERRVSCQDATPYPNHRDTYERLLSHILQLQKAALHAALQGRNGEMDGNVVEFPASSERIFDTTLANDLAELDTARLEDVVAEAAKAFAGLTRKGFEPLADDTDPRIDAFRLAAGALVTMAEILRRMLRTLESADGENDGLTARFTEDRTTFIQHFSKLYGVTT